MALTDAQLRKLKASLKPSHIKSREADGITLHYLEGWRVVAEANRIFGFDGWDRETMTSQCVSTKQLGARFTAAYVSRIRITVRAGGLRILREGSGAGEATALTPGAAHELALKAAETDATKRALSTFGNAFGLSLYSGVGDEPRRRNGELNGPKKPPADPTDQQVARVDKSVLLRAEPKRHRDKDHLRWVSILPCLICGRKPAHAHHLTHAQARAMGSKASDEFVVPLCSLHHRDLHEHGNESEWWHLKNIDPIPLALGLWQQTRAKNSKSSPPELEMPQVPDTETHASSSDNFSHEILGNRQNSDDASTQS
jgi:DNA recombination protein Rad52